MGEPPAIRTITTEDGPVSYRRWGEGPPLLLLAGLGSSARLWGEFPALFTPAFTVLAPDNRGVGGSRPGAAFTLEGAADDAAAVLHDAGGGAAAVLGASMGGLIACELAARHRELVRKLVVASCGVRLTPSHRRVLRFCRIALTRLEPAEAADSFMAFAFAAGFADRYPGFVDQAARLWQPEPEDIPGAIAQTDHLAAGFDLTDVTRRIVAPTLVIAGAVDPIASPAATRELADLIPHATFRLVAGAAHSVLAEGGAALLEEVRSFLAA
jgi:pimeloyl-ACP methyl ester carboxylesterase